MTDKKELLKKLYALSLSGVDGEKENAKRLLDKLSKKYSVSLEELDSDTETDYNFYFHGKEQEQLLMQIAYKVKNSAENIFNVRNNKSGRKIKTKLVITCTEAQKLEIEFLFEFYKRLWDEEKGYLMRAFIQKHRLFGDSEGDEVPNEEYERIARMTLGLADATPLKAIKED